MGNINLHRPLILKKIEGIEKAKKIFPSTKMVSFRVACRDEKGPVNYFLKLVGIKNLEIIKSNEGIGNKATRFKNKQNKENPF